ncbi:MAG: response regulator [Verrucomicrobiota bacterium]
MVNLEKALAVIAQILEQNLPLCAAHIRLNGSHPEPKRDAVCWSISLVAADGRILGALDIYHAQGREFQSTERALAELAAKNAIAEIERKYFVDLVDQISQKLNLLETAVKDMKEAVMITDNSSGVSGLQILFVNEAATKLTGYSKEELIGQSIHMLQGPKTDQKVLQKLRDAMARGESITVEAVNYRKDESEFICNWSVSPIRDASGQVTQWVSIQRDVTDLRHSEEELIHSRKLRAVGELAGGIAHEFKNLLTPMLLQIQAVGDELAGRPDLMNELLVVKDAITKAKDLSERVLVIGRKTATNNEWCHLDDLVEDSLKLVRKTIDRRIDIVTRLEPELPFMWICRSAFSQVLLNLIFNARDTLLEKIQEPHPQAYIPRITISLEQAVTIPPASLGMGTKELSCQRLAIEDNGKGIPPELWERMFDPFFTTKGPQRGTGLGLSLVWNLVHAMGGWIQVQSVPVIGTRMLVFFPETAETPPENLSQQPAVETLVVSQQSKEKNSMKILLVEDEPVVAKAMAFPMRRHGYDVVIANDGQHGLQEIQKNPDEWDLVMSDLNMPNMDGAGFVDNLRKNGYKGKVVIVTGYVAEEDMQRLQRVNVDEVLTKPISREELLACLQRLLHKDEQPVEI